MKPEVYEVGRILAVIATIARKSAQFDLIRLALEETEHFCR